MQNFFPSLLEEQASKHSSYMNLPEPASGETFTRLVRLPFKGRETVVDINSCGHRYRVRITRFLSSLREFTLKKTNIGEFGKQNITPPSIEISSSYIEAETPTVRLLNHLEFNDFSNDLEDDKEADHFFLFHTNSKDFVCRGISNPHNKKWPEDWILMINQSYGLELYPPRRLVYQAT